MTVFVNEQAGQGVRAVADATLDERAMEERAP